MAQESIDNAKHLEPIQLKAARAADKRAFLHLPKKIKGQEGNKILLLLIKTFQKARLYEWDRCFKNSLNVVKLGLTKNRTSRLTEI